MNLLCLLLLLLQGNQPPTDIKVDFTETVTTINLPLLVQRNGRHYSGLTLSALQITENGVRIEPSDLTEVQTSLTIHFLFDLSTSHSRNIYLAKKTAGDMVGKMTEGDRAKVSYFSSSYQPLTPYTEDRARLQRSLSFMAPVGSTALYDGISASLKELSAVSGARVLVLFSDGHDLMSRTSEDDLISQARNFQIPILFVTFNDGKDTGQSLLQAQTRYMERLAVQSGGQVFTGLSSNSRGLVKTMKNFRSRYLVRFSPPGADDLEQWRSLMVRIPNCPECRLQYRRAYSISGMNRNL